MGLSVSLLVLSGCFFGGPSRVQAPSINTFAASSAMSKYDTDGDGKIAGPELDKAPALKGSLKKLDTNGDGAVSVDEISARIGEWQKSRVGLMSMACVVTMDGRPLEGATVTLVPEEFLGSSFKQASGTTAPGGLAILSITPDPSDPTATGVAAGFYTVKISKMSGGQETVPAKYNTETTLGCEVAQDADWALQGSIAFALSSR